LIGLLPHLTATLAVALSGDHHRATAMLAQLSACECQVDAGEHIVHAVRAVLNAARVHDERGVGLSVESSSRDNALGRNAADMCCKFRCVFLDALADLVAAVGALIEVCFIHHALVDQHAQHGIQQRCIRAGAHRQPEVGRTRDGRRARVHNYQRRSVVARAPDPVHTDREALRHNVASTRSDLQASLLPALARLHLDRS
jgi:hypothetical protein